MTTNDLTVSERTKIINLVIAEIKRLEDNDGDFKSISELERIIEKLERM